MSQDTGEDMVGRSRWDAATVARDADAHAAFLDEAAASPQVQAPAAVAAELMALSPGMSVLEVGCGTGYTLPELARAVAPGGRVVGVDLAEPLLAVAARRVADADLGEQVRVAQGDANALDLPDDDFDVARTERVLMHQEDPLVQLGEMRRVVRPGGLVVAIEPDMRCIHMDGSDDPEAIDLLVGRFGKGTRAPGVGLQLRRLMLEAGLVDVVLRHVPSLLFDFEHLGFARWEHNVAGAVSDGVLVRGRAEAAVDSLRAASEAGTMTCMISFYVGAGRVPAP